MAKMNIFPIYFMSWKKTIVFLSIFCVYCFKFVGIYWIPTLHKMVDHKFWNGTFSGRFKLSKQSNNPTVVYLNLEECNAGSFIGRMVNFLYKWCVVKFILFSSILYIFVEFGFVCVINIFLVGFLNWMEKRGTGKRIDLGLIKYEYT